MHRSAALVISLAVGGGLAAAARADPAACDADGYKAKGIDLYTHGQFAPALVELEAAYRCKPVLEIAALAYAAACGGKSVDKARAYFSPSCRRLDPTARRRWPRCATASASIHMRRHRPPK